MKVERPMNYLKIPMHLCFSTGKVLIDRYMYFSVVRMRIELFRLPSKFRLLKGGV